MLRRVKVRNLLREFYEPQHNETRAKRLFCSSEAHPNFCKVSESASDAKALSI